MQDSNVHENEPLHNGDVISESDEDDDVDLDKLTKKPFKIVHEDFLEESSIICNPNLLSVFNIFDTNHSYTSAADWNVEQLCSS
jgi:hypothetical protein